MIKFSSIARSVAGGTRKFESASAPLMSWLNVRPVPLLAFTSIGVALATASITTAMFVTAFAVLLCVILGRVPSDSSPLEYRSETDSEGDSPR
jgi:hypothetical protein